MNSGHKKTNYENTKKYEKAKKQLVFLAQDWRLQSSLDFNMARTK